MISINRVLLGFIKSRPLTLIKGRLFKYTVKTLGNNSLFSFVLLTKIHDLDYPSELRLVSHRFVNHRSL